MGGQVKHVLVHFLRFLLGDFALAEGFRLGFGTGGGRGGVVVVLVGFVGVFGRTYAHTMAGAEVGAVQHLDCKSDGFRAKVDWVEVSVLEVMVEKIAYRSKPRL